MNIENLNDWLLSKKKQSLIMGILNVTPDSFSDGGDFFEKNIAIDRALEMVKQGADILDIGGESTRPGAASVSVKEELNRVIPVIDKLSKQSETIISIDTHKPIVAEEAINAATLNGAYAMDISEQYGSIATAKKANLIITKKMTSYRQIPYHFGNNPIHQVMINGAFVK